MFTVVGYLPFINVGDNLKLEGKFVTHQEYGRQFKIDTFEKIMPETLDALERYLANGSVKGIGPATAQKIIKEFGEETISIFKLLMSINSFKTRYSSFVISIFIYKHLFGHFSTYSYCEA